MNRFDINRSFAEHMETERTKLNITQAELADKLGLSLSTYKKIISRETEKIDLYTAYRMAKLTGKTIDELLGGDAPHRATMQKVRALTEQQRIFIESIIDFELQFTDMHTDSTLISVIIPTGNFEDGMVWDSAALEKMEVHCPHTVTCGVRITSNHMHPVYVKGDTLLISRRPIRDGDTGIFIDKENGRAYIRKFLQTSPCQLVPLNGLGETLYVDSTDAIAMERWVKFGVVVCRVR